MPMGFSDEDVRRAMLDIFGDDGSSLEWLDGGPAQAPAPAPDAPLPASPDRGIIGGILANDPGQMPAPQTDWSSLDLGLSPTDRAALARASLGNHFSVGNSAGLRPSPSIASMNPAGPPGAAGILPRLPSQPVNLQNNSLNISPSVSARTSEGILGKVNDIYHQMLNKVTSPEVTDILKREGGYVNKAGDYVDLGGRGLAVAGIVTGQPELAFPGLDGIAVAGGLHLLGNGAIVLSDMLAKNRTQAPRDAVGAGVSSVLPPLVDPQPLIDRTGRYFGY